MSFQAALTTLATTRTTTKATLETQAQFTLYVEDYGTTSSSVRVLEWSWSCPLALARAPVSPSRQPGAKTFKTTKFLSLPPVVGLLRCEMKSDDDEQEQSEKNI
ncbi:hypothetical protein ACLKA7_002315 [Drosophila subpalustris]